jgi:acetyltransferase
LTEQWDWQGRHVIVRPIRPEDEDQHLAFLQRLDPEDVRLRVFYSRRSIERTELARLTQIDYGREMAFIATARDAAGAEETLAVARAITDPDNDSAEFGIMVRSDVKGGGLGKRLMHKLIQYQRQQGTRWLVATVLNENDRMLQLVHGLGFTVDKPAPEPGVSAVRLALQTSA